MNTERNLRIASKPIAVPFALYRSSFGGLSHWACYTVFYGAFQPLKLLDFYRPQDIFNPLLYRLSYRARGGIVTGKNRAPHPLATALARRRHQGVSGGTVVDFAFSRSFS